jgi:hypothetical protein
MRNLTVSEMEFVSGGFMDQPSNPLYGPNPLKSPDHSIGLKDDIVKVVKAVVSFFDGGDHEQQNQVALKQLEIAEESIKSCEKRGGSADVYMGNVKVGVNTLYGGGNGSGGEIKVTCTNVPKSK